MTVPSVVHAVRSDGFAGVERYVCDVASELVVRGWDVTVMGGAPDRMRAELPSACAYVAASTTPALLRALARSRASLVHAHMTAADVAAAAASLPFRSRALVTTRHFASPRGRTPVMRSALRGVAESYDVRLAISRFVAESDADREEAVLLNGVPDRRPVPLSERTRTVVVVQRHEPEKQTEIALRAWASSRLRQEGWRLALAGRGSQTSALRDLASRLTIEASVDVLGFVPDAAQLMASSGALLATAPAEPYGLAVVEAMSTGTPVIATAAGGHLETLGADGWTFPSGDAEACSTTLDRLELSPDVVEAYAAQLWTRQRQHLAIGRHVDSLEDHYRRALARRGRVVQ